MITSLQNKRVRTVVRLHKRKYRDRQRKMIVEGYQAITCAVENKYPLDELYFCPPLFLGSNERALLRRAQNNGARVIEVAEAPFRKMTCGGRLDGLLAVAPQIRRSLLAHPPAPNGLYVIAESIARPGNLGAIVRSADGAGANAVIISDPHTDVFDPQAVRASRGTLFSVPVLESSTPQALSWCRKNGIHTLATSPHTSMVYTDVNMRGPLAIAVGTEQSGLSRVWLEQAHIQVRLPMLGRANSLNVAVAATVLLYEAVRQRRLD
jgi:TrmH family RNA methyltransferase